MSDSDFRGFYRKSIDERIGVLAEHGMISSKVAQLLRESGGMLSPNTADRMIENVVGVFGLPLAVVPRFLLNGKHYTVPMVVEEPSIVAGINGAAKLFATGGGFFATADDPVLAGQIQVPAVGDPDLAITRLRKHEKEFFELSEQLQPNLGARGGGLRSIDYRKLPNVSGNWDVVLHLMVDTADAMGANIVNTLCEGIAPRVESLLGTSVGLKILSNLADGALVNASATLSLPNLHRDAGKAEAVRDAIVQASDFAAADPYRAATHNKGIMNGMDAVAIATGNDWRSLEAGAHAYAARGRQYTALARWSISSDGDLRGESCMPVKVGVVGGSLQSNPAAVAGLEIANTTTARELAGLIAAVGLAQNFAALKALATDGIQKGHMRLHARSVAASIGTPDRYFERVVKGMIRGGDVKRRKAADLLEEFRRADQPLAAQPFANQSSAEVTSDDADSASGEACGKIILLGEHAVVYGKHALALPLPDAVSATVSPVEAGLHISVRDWNIEQQIISCTDSASGLTALLALILKRLDISDPNYRIDVRARIPAAVGLGSSASLAVAVIRAFSKLLALQLDDETVNGIALECEQLAHGTPSGIDNTLAVYGEPVLYNRSASPKCQPVPLNAPPPLVVAVGQSRGSTLAQVAGVRERYDADRKTYQQVFAQIDQLSLSGAAALQAEDYRTLGSIMNVCHGLLNAIQVSTPELESMIDIARCNGALGAKLTGAGGGGAIVALCPETTSDVAGALRSAGFTIIQTQSDPEL